MSENKHDRPSRSVVIRWRRAMILLCAVVLVVFTSEVAMACPTCKDTLAEGGANAMNMVRGYFWSILFMMSMPFLILGTLISYFYYEVCKARARETSGESSSPPPAGPRRPQWTPQHGESLA